jgi:hypothetical protein
MFCQQLSLDFTLVTSCFTQGTGIYCFHLKQKKKLICINIIQSTQIKALRLKTENRHFSYVNIQQQILPMIGISYI